MSGTSRNPATGSTSGKRTVYVAAAVVLAMAAGGGWWAYSRSSGAGADAPQAADGARVARDAEGGVTLSQAQLRAQGIEVAAINTATQLPVPGLPAQAMAPLGASAQVAAPYAGVVTRILVDEGSMVRQGQALARIQSREVLAALGELARARSEATAAQLQAKRDAALLAEGIIAASRNEQSQARAAAAQSTLREASGALAQLRPVEGGQAGEYELLAPMSGQVVRRHLAPGQAVEALGAAFVVAEPGLMDVNFSAPLRLRVAIKPGLQVRLPDGSAARVVAVGADADPSSQSLRVRARIEQSRETGTLYTAGQQFSVTLLLPAPEGALAVPPSALVQAGQGHVLYVADAEKDAAQGPVRIHPVAVQLLGGDEGASVVMAVAAETGSKGPPSVLTAGTRVVTRGTALLKSMIPLQ